MTQRDEVYKCEACGNLIGVIHGAGGDLVCCGQKMVLLKANSTDASAEKDVFRLSRKWKNREGNGRGSTTPHGGKTLH